jgi:hypothetical protein
VSDKSFGAFLFGALGLSVTCLLVFGLLRWLGMPSGQLVDWVIGLATFWWLLVIVTIPWNIFFGARQVLDEAAESQRRGIAVESSQLAYARRWVRWALIIAIVLHLASAAALYALAAVGVSAIGYLASAAALLLTGLRPVVAGYAYISERLRAIGQQVRYPREDIVELRANVRSALERLDALEYAADTSKPDSAAAHAAATLHELQQRLERQRLMHEELRASNATEHNRLAREAEQAVARISADGQVLNHVRELVRFFKNA